MPVVRNCTSTWLVVEVRDARLLVRRSHRGVDVVFDADRARHRCKTLALRLFPLDAGAEDQHVRIVALTPRGKDLIVKAFRKHAGRMKRVFPRTELRGAKRAGSDAEDCRQAR
jgi:hypothetical protein